MPFEGRDMSNIKQNHFDWIAEHLTHLHINAIGDKMDIDYLDNEGHTQTLTHQAPDCEESYPEMLHKAIDSILEGGI